jgi:hypothetical protein
MTSTHILEMADHQTMICFEAFFVNHLQLETFATQVLSPHQSRKRGMAGLTLIPHCLA